MKTGPSNAVIRGFLLAALIAFAPIVPAGEANSPYAVPIHPLLAGKAAPPAAGEPLRLVHMTDAHVVADGKVLLKHRKINNLPDLKLLTPPYLDGSKEDIGVVETALGRIGVLICADTFVEEHLEVLRALRPNLLLVPYGWAAPRDRWPGHGQSLKETVAKAARTAGASLLGPSCLGEITSGPWKGRTYEGESAAAGPDGDILFFGVSGRRQVAVFPVPLEKAAKRGF